MFVSSGFSVPGNAAPFDFVIDAKRVEDWSLFAFCFVVISFWQGVQITTKWLGSICVWLYVCKFALLIAE